MVSALEVVPLVEELLDARVERPAEWWVRDTPFVQGPEEDRTRLVLTRTVGQRIEIGELCFWNPHHFVAHVYVHWVVSRQPAFQNLPSFVEEGLAAWVAQSLTGWDFASGPGEAVRERYSPQVCPFGPELAGRDPSCGDELAELRVGPLMLVDAIGLDRLRDLAAAGATGRDYSRVAAEALKALGVEELDETENPDN